MDFILDFFDFNMADVPMLFGRFGFLVLLSLIVFFVVTFIVMQITKAKPSEIGVSNLFKVACMWGIVFAILAVGVTIILTIRANGTYYFELGRLEWSLVCGYLLMLPEITLIIGWLTTYFIIQSRVKNSLK